MRGLREFQLTAIRQAMRDSVPPSPIVDTNAGTKLRGDSSWKHKCDLQIRKEVSISRASPHNI